MSLPSFTHVSHGLIKLGLRGRRLFKSPSLSNYMTPSAVAYPPVCAWERPIDWLMLGNDRIGDCVIAWMLHQIMAWKAVAHAGSPATFTDEQAIQIYSAITGYVPGDESTDLGAVPDDALASWRDAGIFGDKIAGSVDLDISNLDMLKSALYLFGGIGLSIQVPRYVLDVPSGGSWSYAGGDKTIIGEHQILGIGFGRQGFRIVSWGTTYTINFDFLSENLMGSQAVVSEDWIKQSGTAPSGIDLATLQADLAALKA